MNKSRGNVQEYIKTLSESELRTMFHTFNSLCCSMVLTECLTCHNYKPCQCDFEPWCKNLTWEWIDMCKTKISQKKTCPKCHSDKIAFFFVQTVEIKFRKLFIYSAKTDLVHSPSPLNHSSTDSSSLPSKPPSPSLARQAFAL